MNLQTNKLPRNFQLCEGYACFTPAGSVALVTAVELITTAIIFARDNQLKRLLVDATQLVFPSPSIPERYWIVRKWAEESKNAVEVALVLERSLIDPERFGVQVAINLGLRADVFETRLEALSWLISGAKPFPLAPRD